jgi:surfeit locus 1 family protein
MTRARRWLAGVAALAAVAATFGLGQWQWGRAQQKVALHAAQVARGAMAPLDVPAVLAAPLAEADLHRPVVLQGTWAALHTVFLDNRQMQGRQGFYVVTPLVLRTPPGQPAQAILVQRGWAPRNFADRTALPPVQTPAGPVTVQGRLAPPPAKLLEFDSAPQGAIRQNLDLAAFRAETGLDLLGVAAVQVGAASDGLSRDWPEPVHTAGKNYGYAFQWWALSALTLALYVWFGFIAPSRAARAR